MTFVEKYAGAIVGKAGCGKSFLLLDTNSDFYDFLWENGALPDEKEKVDAYYRIAFKPWKDDIFTAYKTILHGMILTNLYPLQHSGNANIFLDEYEAIQEIYKKRSLTQPSDEQLSVITTEMRRIAEGYAKAIINGQIEKHMSR